MAGYLLFETALGSCGIAWSDDGLIASALPPGDAPRLKKALAARHLQSTDDLPGFAAQAMEGITALMVSGREDLTGLVLDERATPEFEREVYALTRAIPPGKTRSYGELATALGNAGLARKVGQALGLNPWPIIVPCHRVIGGSGALTGFSAPGGVAAKRRLLALEGAAAVAQGDLFER
jgi:methylated-DNA-[protein]-cysteine S-methyltransferase